MIFDAPSSAVPVDRPRGGDEQRSRKQEAQELFQMIIQSGREQEVQELFQMLIQSASSPEFANLCSRMAAKQAAKHT